jgi:hypothetical protein
MNLTNHKGDKDKKYCPYCAKLYAFEQFNEHIKYVLMIILKKI